MNIADINAEARKLCDTDSVGYTAADLLRRVNAAYEEIVGKLIALSEGWQFDDTNWTDLPIGRGTLVNGQNDYAFDSTFLEVEGVSVKDASGDWQKLTPIDKSQMGVDPEEFYEVDGLPTYYDKQGSSIFLYPAPDNGVSVTLTNGLKVFFLRTAAVFTTAEVNAGTKTPGFAAPYHILLAYKAALPYCLSYKKDRVPMIQREIDRLEKDLLNFYARREKDVRKKLTMAPRSFR